MDNLIKNPIQDGETPKLVLAELSGEESPAIGENIRYSWKIDLEGSKKFTRVKFVKVVFKFSDKEVSIKEFVPKREQEEKATLILHLIPNVASVSLPIVDEKVTGRQTAEGVEWVFYGITLPDKPAITLSGHLVVEFQRGAENKKILVQMLIEPSFYRKYLKWIHPTHQPHIDYSYVSERTKAIKPYDPKFGKPSSDKPDEERIQEYEWEIKEGILKKDPGIRNVALRTETFSLILSYLQKKNHSEKYREAMRSAGFEIGVKFIDNVECMRTEKEKFTLNEWRDYDSAAGMGRFEFKKDKEGKLQEIEIKNSFIAYDRCSDEPVCDFFCGYFEGGLGKIYGKRFIVTEKKCIAQGALSCVFEVREISNAPAPAFANAVVAFLSDFSGASIGDKINIEGPVTSSGNYYGLSFFNVTDASNKEISVYSSTDHNILTGDYIYAIGIKTGPNEMIAYLIEKQTPLQKELNKTHQ